MCKRRLWKWASLFIGAQLGNLERSLFAGNPKREMEGSGNGASLSRYGSSVRGTWRGALLLGTLRDMQRKALETGISVQRGPVEGPWRECCLSRDIERKVRFYFIRRPCLLCTV